jgi:fused signal recognition particle receptor
MFGKLKEKLRNWTKKISEKAEEKEVIEAKVKKGREKKEIQLPEKFNIVTQKVEPDLERVQEVEEEPESFLSKIKSKITKVKISEKDFEVYAEELELLLLENNVALEVAEKIIRELKQKIVGKELLKKEIEFEIKDSLRGIIERILVEPFDISQRIKEKNTFQNEPYVILFCGINGTGKTTTMAKIAEYLKKKKITSVLAAGDTFRAASIEQLKKHGEKLGMKVISHDYNSDPAAVGFDAIKYAKLKKINCVLIDTAGRMHTAKNLLKEIEKISRVCKPDAKIFVGESLTGNDSIEQVRSFNLAIGIDGIILTKADIDEKGGTSLSLGYVTKKPILFLGTGQDYDSIEPFNKQKFIEKLGL